LNKEKSNPKRGLALLERWKIRSIARERGMCAGSFKVHIDVNEENGNMDSKHFIIKVPRALHWPLLTVETLECDCPK
jgi:hypothetical protein